jgi:hypothetical protein
MAIRHGVLKKVVEEKYLGKRFAEFVNSGPESERSAPLTKSHVDALLSGVRDGMQRLFGTTLMSKASTQQSATNEVQARIAERINRNPTTVTQAIAMQQVFEADPALYERYRIENTLGRDGQPTSSDPMTRTIGIAKSVDAEVARRVEQLMAKTSGATRQQAMQFVFQQDPALYEQWRRESCA